MKTRTMLLQALLFGCGLAGCASRQPLVNVPSVSMSLKSLDPGQKGTKIGPVSVQYCAGDKPIATTDSVVGLMDEAIAKAEKETGASYITDAQFFTKGSCVILEGVAMKAAGGPVSSN